MKTNKSFTKRLKITRKGKLVARKPGQNHFNAKERRNKQLSTRRTQALSLPVKVAQRYINTVK
jgi:ribosomal protein L35